MKSWYLARSLVLSELGNRWWGFALAMLLKHCCPFAQVTYCIVDHFSQLSIGYFLLTCDFIFNNRYFFILIQELVLVSFIRCLDRIEITALPWKLTVLAYEMLLLFLKWLVISALLIKQRIWIVWLSLFGSSWWRNMKLGKFSNRMA